MAKSRLEDALLTLFLRVEAEGRRSTAEHLLRALESLYAVPDAAPVPPPTGSDAAASAEQSPSPDPDQG